MNGLNALSDVLGLPPQGQEEGVAPSIERVGGAVLGAEEGSLLVLDREKQELIVGMTVGNTSSEQVLVGQRDSHLLTRQFHHIGVKYVTCLTYLGVGSWTGGDRLSAVTIPVAAMPFTV